MLENTRGLSSESVSVSPRREETKLVSVSLRGQPTLFGDHRMTFVLASCSWMSHKLSTDQQPSRRSVHCYTALPVLSSVAVSDYCDEW